MHSQYDYLFKLLLVGNIGVGKSCLLSRFVDDIYSEDPTGFVGAHITNRTIDFENNVIKLQIWDVGGQEQYSRISSEFYHNVHGIIINYDVTDQESFVNVKQWLEDIDRYASENVTKLLVGNKCDLTAKRTVDYVQAKEYADSLNIPFLETSAKNSMNIDEAFLAIVAKIKSHMSSVQSRPSSLN